MPKLLVVDDEPIILRSFGWVVAGPGVEVLTAGSVTDGWDRFQQDRPDVVVLDLQLPDGSGLDLFERIRAADPRRPVVFITAHGTTDTAIGAMKRGAFDYLLKPLDLDALTGVLDRAFDAARLVREPAALPDDPGVDRIVGRSPAIQGMCKAVGRVAPLDVNVLILGESGTGKELVARAIYHHSNRADKPFLAINCAALPEALVESELFGHEPGAFTGADRRRIGRFEQCDGGTILLDEVGDMPPAVQAKMLRLLQDQTFERVGGGRPLTTRVRILAATNQNLEALIAAGRFRADLYYRLKVVTIGVPPLRDRRADIPELAYHFLFRAAQQSRRDVRGFSAAALDHLRRADWPGNVRQLQNAVERAVALGTGRTVLPGDLPTEGDGPAGPAAVGEAAELDLTEVIENLLREGETGLYGKVIGTVERRLIARVLQHTRGHLGRTSELLGIDRKTFRLKLRELGLAVEKVVSDRADPEAEASGGTR